MADEKLLKKTLFAIILLIIFTHSVEGFTPVEVKPFRCEISTSAEQQLSHGVYLTFTVINLTDHELQLLSWYTPFEGFLSDMFIIEGDVGDPLGYNGMMVKRSTPSIEDYLILPAKDKVEITLDLTQAYALTQGEYTVQLASKNWHYKHHETSLTSQCLANSFKIKIT